MSAQDKPDFDSIEGTELRRSLEEIYNSICEKKAVLPPAQSAPLQSRQSAQVIQLPLPCFAERKVSTPNCFLRSETFAATDRGLDYVEKAPMKSVDGYEIRFTGKRLSQQHLVLWEAIVRLAGRHPLGTECLFTGNSFLKKELGYKGSIGKKNYEDLDLALTELRGGTIEVKINGHLSYNAGAIDYYVRDDDTKVFKVKLNVGLLALFGRSQWSSLEWEQRLSLRKHPLALWLHGFIASNAKTLPISVEWYQERSGCGTQSLKKFRQSLKKALEKIKSVGVISSWEITTNDLVMVENIPTPAQIRHLAANPKNHKNQS